MGFQQEKHYEKWTDPEAQLRIPFFLQVSAYPKTPYVVLDTMVSASIQNPAQSHLLHLELVLGVRKPAASVCVETLTKVSKTHSYSVSKWPKPSPLTHKDGPVCSSTNITMEHTNGCFGLAKSHVAQHPISNRRDV